MVPVDLPDIVAVLQPDSSNPPWHPLSAPTWWTPVPTLPPLGRLISYYSENAAFFPVRNITKKNDNKCDPNIETMTFGLFSICDRRQRRKMATENGRFLFFRTQRDDAPVVAGYYELGWYVPSWTLEVPDDNPRVSVQHDYFLAAKRCHWVEDPIPLADAANATGLGLKYLKSRTPPKLNQDQTQALLDLLDAQPDVTDRYVDAVHRTERFQASVRPDGFMYANWRRKRGFTWADAKFRLRHAKSPMPDEATLAAWNKRGVMRHTWKCDVCKTPLASLRFIKFCSNCPTGGQMRPAFLDEART